MHGPLQLMITVCESDLNAKLHLASSQQSSWRTISSQLIQLDHFAFCVIHVTEIYNEHSAVLP